MSEQVQERVGELKLKEFWEPGCCNGRLRRR
jgi:hypothetical protein